ncbi:MAG: hypothetical protein HYR60_22620 [Acidobacteria bacterium]|nr:hypothetical protein [Acidobacteriota bacterium]
MPEEPKPVPEEPKPPVATEAPPGERDKDDVGDFITRHVLEKDSVFFEG